MIQSNAKLLKKAKAKYMSGRLALGLAEYNPDSILRTSYVNSYYCAQNLVYNPEEGLLKTKYCKNRWCMLCQRIKMADMMNGYASQIKNFEDPYFVTLTAPTVVKGSLRDRIKDFQKTWRLIQQGYQDAKKYNKVSFQHFRGVRKMECTIRPQGRFHYHFHVAIDGYEQADWLEKQWLKRFSKARKKRRIFVR